MANKILDGITVLESIFITSLFFLALPASASVIVVCSDSTVTIGNVGYISCQGPIGGNIAPNKTNNATFTGYGTFDLVGSSDDSGFGPFKFNPGTGTSGTVTFDSPAKGYFVLGLKGGPDYSLYLFNGGIAGIGSLNFDTFGITTGGEGAGPGLSHAAFFTNRLAVPDGNPVPEPATTHLIGLGLLGFAYALRWSRPNA